MSGNLPPGVTPADIDRHYGGGLEHDHEWHPVEDEHPVLEDRAAVFHEQCVWREVVATHTDYARDEVYEEHGQECGETRWRRFDLAYVAISSEEATLRLDRDALDWLEGVEAELLETINETLHEAGRAHPEDTATIEVDPDPETGLVVIRYDGFEFGYRPGGGA
jgi:hypothetical protein